MNIRAYEGYTQPMGSDLLSALRTEGEKFLSNLAQPVTQQINQILPTPAQAPAPMPAPQPVIAARALPQPEQTAAALSPIAVIIMLYLAWQFLGKK